MASDQNTTPEARFAALVEELRGEAAVTPPSAGNGFGSAGLKVHHRIFAMLAAGRLVLKLPHARVDALVASGDGERFDPRRDGRKMKEWIALDTASDASWQALAREAMVFVAASASKR